MTKTYTINFKVYLGEIKMNCYKYGSGNIPLVLLHGWGMNSSVWKPVIELLSSQFTLHLFDLPGYGINCEENATSLDDITNLLADKIPNNAIIAGWSLGGLVALRLAMKAEKNIKGLAIIASSPCFIEKNDWAGISPDIFQAFKSQLAKDKKKTIKKFLALQTIGTTSSRKDAVFLQNIVLESLPDISVLDSGLDLLINTDLRNSLLNLKSPVIRIYGEFDTLIPTINSQRFDILCKQGTNTVVPSAGHVPFISHPEEFSQLLIDFSRKIT